MISLRLLSVTGRYEYALSNPNCDKLEIRTNSVMADQVGPMKPAMSSLNACGDRTSLIENSVHARLQWREHDAKYANDLHRQRLFLPGNCPDFLAWLSAFAARPPPTRRTMSSQRVVGDRPPRLGADRRNRAIG